VSRRAAAGRSGRNGRRFDDDCRGNENLAQVYEDMRNIRREERRKKRQPKEET
jgi:hypothetical protein